MSKTVRKIIAIGGGENGRINSKGEKLPSYEPENELAKKLYASFGFEETGEMDGDEIVAVLKL